MIERKIKHIYWFTYYNLDAPSVRYRAKYPLDFAKDRLGITSRLIIPGYSPKRIWNFLRGFLSALLFPKEGAIVVIQRVRSDFIYAYLLRFLLKNGKVVSVYDLDDADYLQHDPGMIHLFARHCDCVSAGSTEIAKYLSMYNENVLHITSPTPDLGTVKSERNRTFTIGWVGGFSWGHKDSLFAYLFPAVKRLVFDCELVIIGVTDNLDECDIRDYFADKPRVQLRIERNINWKDERDIQSRIRNFDVGIATLENVPVQRAKSGIKAKQYMNGGVPVLCNDLPENNSVVINGFNGFICKSTLEFEKRLIELREMSDTDYWTLSQHARQSIVNFDHNKYFDDFERLVAGNGNA